jgi:Oxidoreductase molybdopterin binding domain
MPRSETSGSIYCDGDLVSSGNWGGVQISYLLNQANMDPTATDLEFHAADGYKINVQAEAAIQQNMIIAYELDRQPLNEVLRLALPGYPGNYWISMITEITVTKSTNYNIATNYYQMQVSGSTSPASLPKPTATPKSTPIVFPTQQPTPSTKPTLTPNSTIIPTPTPEGTLTPQPETTATPKVTQTPNPPIDNFPAEYIYAIVVVVLFAVIALGAIRFAKHRSTRQ